MHAIAESCSFADAPKAWCCCAVMLTGASTQAQGPKQAIAWLSASLHDAGKPAGLSQKDNAEKYQVVFG